MLAACRLYWNLRKRFSCGLLGGLLSGRLPIFGGSHAPSMALSMSHFIAAAVLAVPLYIFYGLIALIVRQARSPLRHIKGPPAPSWFFGNLGQMYDAENTDLYERWMDTYGRSLVYRGFCGGSRLFTSDPKALTHILSHTYDYPKPSFVRASLAMMGGEHGLVVVEGVCLTISHTRLKQLSGDKHKRQVSLDCTHTQALKLILSQRRILVSVKGSSTSRRSPRILPRTMPLHHHKSATYSQYSIQRLSSFATSSLPFPSSVRLRLLTC
jgi:hypothetical protein